MFRVSCYQSAMRSAGDMLAAQGVFALTILSLLMSSGCASYRTSRSHGTCTPDITDADAYRTEHPICSRLAAETQAGRIPIADAQYWPAKDFQKNPRTRCAMRLGPKNITLLWSNDPSRAASAMLAALLRHVYKFQRVHLAPEGTLLSQLHKPDELVISLAAVVQNKVPGVIGDGLKAFARSNVPTRRRLHAWLTPAVRLFHACQHTNWTLYTNLTARTHCGFLVPSPSSFAESNEAVEILGVGDDCNETMHKLQQRVEAVGTPTGAVFVNRTVFKRYLLTSNHSFLFLDFDMWSGVPGVSVMEPPPCVSDLDDGECKPELDDSTGMLVTIVDILKVNSHLFSLSLDFKPEPESLRWLLDQEANGVNLEEAACEWAEMHKGYVQKDINSERRVTVVAFLCVADPDNYSYDMTIKSVGNEMYLYTESSRLLDISSRRYFINCSDPYNMSRKLDNLMEQSDALNILGVVSLGVDGAAAASAVAAVHRVPLLFARVVPDEHATGYTTWQTAGRLRHIALAFQHFVNESGWTQVIVLSQPTAFARHYFAALKDKATFLLRDFEIPLDLTEQQAKEALRYLQEANTRVVVVNTDSDAATLILAAAVKLNMSYMDGFIWIVREPQIRANCSTKHFTVWINKLVDFGPSGGLKLWPSHRDSLNDALMTISIGFNNVFQQHSDMLTHLHSDQVIRAFDDSLKKTPVTGFNEVQLHYKERVLEEAFVYVNELCNFDFSLKYRQLAKWRVNATSGSVRNEDGTHATLLLDVSVKRDAGPDAGADAGADVYNSTVRTDTDGGKQHAIVTDKPANTSNTVFIVHQRIDSITKIETPINGVSVSDILRINNNLNVLRLN